MHLIKTALITLLLFSGVICVTTAQHKGAVAFNQQLTFTCDNNFLLFNGDDGYYTSGLFLRYDRLRNKPLPAVLKQVLSYEVAQQLYTAHSRKILPNATQQFPGGLVEIDRPIAGYLYAKASLTTVFKNNKLLLLGMSVGSIGDNSFGRESYAFWHRVIGVKEHWNWVWDHQVEDALGANVHGTFAAPLLNKAEWFQVTSVTEATLGTSFTDFTQAVMLQYGKLLPMAGSSYWHTRLANTPNAERGRHELFVYYKPALSYQLYNATIEGGRFNETQQGIIAAPEPLVLAHEVGVRFSTPRYCLAYQFVLQSKEAKSQFRQQTYGSLTMAFRFAKSTTP